MVSANHALSNRHQASTVSDTHQASEKENTHFRAMYTLSPTLGATKRFFYGSTGAINPHRTLGEHKKKHKRQKPEAIDLQDLQVFYLKS